MLTATAVIVLLLAAAFVVYVKAMERRMIYYPSAEMGWTPANARLPYEDLRLQCTDGVTIHGWFVPAAGSSRGTVLFLHGNAGSISHRYEKLLILHGLKLDVCIIDYHGYGRSGGQPCERTTYLDADAAYDWLTKFHQTAPGQIILWGESLGGGVATYLAAKHTVGGLVLESTYTSLPDVARTIFPFLPARLIMSTRYDSLGRIRQIHVPVLGLHSPQDEVIPYRLGKRLYEAANPPKMFVDLTGDHNAGFLISGDTFPNAVRVFVERYVSAPRAN